MAANATLWNGLLDEEQRLLEIRRGTALDRRAVALRSVLVAVAVSLVLIFVLARRISHNVGEVAEAAAELASGDLSRRADVSTGDEVGAMATAFNAMADQLQASVESIEETVRNRTRELSERTSSLQLLQAVAVAANEAATVEEALQITLDRVCASAGWPVGHALLRVDSELTDREPVLVSSGVWHIEDEERYREVRRVSAGARFASGIGLPGRVLAAGKPDFVEDIVLDGNFPRRRPVPGHRGPCRHGLPCPRQPRSGRRARVLLVRAGEARSRPARADGERRHPTRASDRAGPGGGDPPAVQGGGRERQPHQERLPGQHEPRAAHAPERHHRLQRDPRGGPRGPGPGADGLRRRQDPHRPGSTCWA